MGTFRFSLCAVLVFSLLSFIVNHRDHVSLLGGGDEGSYIGAGKLMSRSLRFVFDDAVAERGKGYVPANTLVPDGFQVHKEDVSPVQVASGWNKGFPFLSVPFWWIAPDNGWQFLNPLAGSVSIALIYFIGAAVSAPFTGLCAALLLGTNWLQIWYSRYPMTEVTSQALILSMVLVAVKHYRSGRKTYLFLFALLASLSSFVHFANVPMWLLIGMALCVRDLGVPPFGRFSWTLSGILSYCKELRLSRLQLRSFVSTSVVSLCVPALATVGYWLCDPGIQRYTRLGAKMARTSGRLSLLWESTLIRLENLALFIPSPVWILLLIACALLLTKRVIERKMWFLLVGLGLFSFLVIASTGVGTPRVLYVARRNVPVVLPIMFLMSALALNQLPRLSRYSRIGYGFSTCVLLGLCALQLAAFAPFRSLDQGRGMPELLSTMRDELKARSDGRPQFVIVPGVSSIFKSGMRYVYDVPALSFSKHVTPELLSRMLADDLQIFILDDSRGRISSLVKQTPGVEILPISTNVIAWQHANHLKPTAYPHVSKLAQLRFTFGELVQKR